MGVYTAVLLFIGLWATCSLYVSPLLGIWRSLLPIYGMGLLVGHHLGHLLASTKDEK
jgi:hypothetical protein